MFAQVTAQADGQIFSGALALLRTGSSSVATFSAVEYD